MDNSIGSIGKSFYQKQYEKVAGSGDQSAFKQTLTGIAEKMNDIQNASNIAAEKVVLGQSVDSHDVMIASQEAGLAFDLILEVRNKLIDAYHEIMRMQI